MSSTKYERYLGKSLLFVYHYYNIFKFVNFLTNIVVINE